MNQDKIRPLRLSLSVFLFPLLTAAQFGGPLSERPGTFEILSRTDYASTACGFTKAELIANMQQIKNLVSVVRQNPVLSEIKGFNGRARIYDIGCRKCGYGVPSRVSFEFSSFFLNKAGKVVFNTIEPPSWSVYLNEPVGHAYSSSFDYDKCYFTVSLYKKAITPGVDMYDNQSFIIHDSSRPDYWIPVTVEEAFASAREFANKNKDEVSASYSKQFIEKEYAEIPAADRNKPAYYGGNVSRVSSTPGIPGQDSIFPHIMKVNPAYWNTSLSKSAIQIIKLESVQNKDYLGKRLAECGQRRDVGSGCDLYRFELSYGLEDIEKLEALLGKY